ncbi:MAG: response regulator transcription factor [Deltaproteobacteria bacterium]|nr:response regulator transcription factor [Deltaproteobacteria bacterium]
MAERVLVVEDERNVGSTLVERLDREGFEVTWTRGVQETRDALKDRRFDLALLDVGLPDGSGFSLAEALRDDHRATAIIFLTALGNPEDRVRGLELGAEDYIVKPFHLKELLLRIRRSLRRARYFTDLAGVEAQPLRVGQALIEFSKFTARSGGVTHALTHKECELLKLLVDRKNRVVSRDEILNHVWSENEFPSPRTIDNFVMRLRRIIETDPENPQIIKSIRGVGYLLADTNNAERIPS